MRVMTRRREELLKRLVRWAGDPVIVQDALRDINSEGNREPNVGDLVKRIVFLKRTGRVLPPANGVGEIAVRRRGLKMRRSRLVASKKFKRR